MTVSADMICDGRDEPGKIRSRLNTDKTSRVEDFHVSDALLGFSEKTTIAISGCFPPSSLVGFFCPPDAFTSGHARRISPTANMSKVVPGGLDVIQALVVKVTAAAAVVAADAAAAAADAAAAAACTD
ncbi:unnamed protein product [Closterium sp. NIES-53]